MGLTDFSRGPHVIYISSRIDHRPPMGPLHSGPFLRVSHLVDLCRNSKSSERDTLSRINVLLYTVYLTFESIESFERGGSGDEMVQEPPEFSSPVALFRRISLHGFEAHNLSSSSHVGRTPQSAFILFSSMIQRRWREGCDDVSF